MCRWNVHLFLMSFGSLVLNMYLNYMFGKSSTHPKCFISCFTRKLLSLLIGPSYLNWKSFCQGTVWHKLFLRLYHLCSLNVFLFFFPQHGCQHRKSSTNKNLFCSLFFPPEDLLFSIINTYVCFVWLNAPVYRRGDFTGRNRMHNWTQDFFFLVR